MDCIWRKLALMRHSNRPKTNWHHFAYISDLLYLSVYRLCVLSTSVSTKHHGTNTCDLRVFCLHRSAPNTMEIILATWTSLTYGGWHYDFVKYVTLVLRATAGHLLTISGLIRQKPQRNIICNLTVRCFLVFSESDTWYRQTHFLIKIDLTAIYFIVRSWRLH